MNQKKLKALRRKVKRLQVEWIKTLLTEEEASQVTEDKIDALSPTQDYYMANRTMYLSYMTPKWIMKYLKNHPEIDSFTELEEYYEIWKANNREKLQWKL